MATDFAICNLFVDGGYVREERKRMDLPMTFNPRGAVKWFLEHDAGRYLGKYFALTRCFYFDPVDPSNREVTEFVNKLESLDETFVHLGSLTGNEGRRRQKGVDLLLAVEALKVARSGSADVIALVAGDADFVPLVKAIRTKGRWFTS